MHRLPDPAAVTTLWAWLHPDGWWVLAVLFGALAALGTADLLQKRSTLRRNYPLLAHFRYGLGSIGPEMCQYFIAEVPFSRDRWRGGRNRRSSSRVHRPRRRADA